MDVARSDVVRSCAGRDSGQLFFVVELDESYVYLADGKGRRVEKPKRKKRKHVALLPRRDSRVADKIRSGDPGFSFLGNYREAE